MAKSFRKNKTVVILLGAGSAIAWNGFKTNDIRELFITDKKFPEIDGKTVGKYIFEILDTFYGHECANFETFIAALEIIQSYIFNETNTGGVNVGNTLLTPAILTLKDEIEKLISTCYAEEDSQEDKDTKKREFSYELFSHYINLVIDEVEKYDINVLDSQYNNLNNNFLQFVRYYLNRGYSVKFYTTNYDSLVPQILSPHIKTYEGLYRTSPSVKRFNYNLNRFREARLSHFNIHGSIFLHNANFVKNETVYGDSKQRLGGTALYVEGGNPSEKLLFTPIITGYNKTQRMSCKPFNLGFSSLIDDCSNCSAILTVGYSFSDPHINAIISSFTDWSRANFAHITFHDDSKDGDYLKSSEFTRLDYDLPTFYEGSEDEYWIHNTNSKKHIYKKGFEEFLKDKLHWKYLLNY